MHELQNLAISIYLSEMIGPKRGDLLAVRLTGTETTVVGSG